MLVVCSWFIIAITANRIPREEGDKQQDVTSKEGGWRRGTLQMGLRVSWCRSCACWITWLDRTLDSFLVSKSTHSSFLTSEGGDEQLTLLVRHCWKSDFISVTATRSWGRFGPLMHDTTVLKSSSTTCNEINDEYEKMRWKLMSYYFLNNNCLKRWCKCLPARKLGLLLYYCSCGTFPQLWDKFPHWQLSSLLGL